MVSVQLSTDERPQSNLKASRAHAARAPDPDLGLRLRDFVLAEMHEAAAQLARPGDDRHQGVHQARKRLRRVRAVLALGRPALGDAGRRLDDEIGQLCRGLSPLRDAQALIEGLERLDADEAGERAGGPEAVGLARQRRDTQLQLALARDPDFRRRRERLADLGRRLERLDWESLDPPCVAAAVKRSERRLERAFKRARRAPGDEERWHVMRRRFRRLRQQDNVLAQEQPDLRPARPVSADEAAALGEAQDDALILRCCGRHSPFPPELRASLRRLARDRLGRARRRALSSPP